MPTATVTNHQGTDEEMLESLLRDTFSYFIQSENQENGLIADKTQKESAASIAVIGLGLSCYIIGVEKKLISREDAVQKTLTVLKFLQSGEQSVAKNAMGYKGFYYHFLDMKTGERAYNCELSTVDTGFFIAGVLTAMSYYTSDNPSEKEIRTICDNIYRRVEWSWALNGSTTISHGWSPESGFLPYRWDRDYSEALLLYILALGSPTFPIEKEGYDKWTKTFKIKTIYDITYLYAGPLFIHQLSHIWIDFRNIKDGFNRKAGFDYFENSRRATYVQRQYAIENKNGFAEYGEFCWGLTASDGPGNETLVINGKKNNFFDYVARGAPFGPDDGTVSPWAVVASLPFAPEIVMDTIRTAIERYNLKSQEWDGFDASFNPTFPEKTRNEYGWVSKYKFGLNQGPIILMIANFQSGFIWDLTKKNNYILNGLKAAGFEGGWISTNK